MVNEEKELFKFVNNPKYRAIGRLSCQLLHEKNILYDH